VTTPADRAGRPPTPYNVGLSRPFGVSPSSALGPHVIRLETGSDAPVLLEVEPGTLVTEFRGPAGVAGPAVGDLVGRSLAAPAHGPPLEAHVVPGDRVSVAVAGTVPQNAHVLAAITASLTSARIAADAITVLHGPALEPAAGGLPAASAEDVFDPSVESSTAYLAADQAAHPLHLARLLVDADVVVAVGQWAWNAALGGRSLEGELWPTFARLGCRRDLTVSLARRGRQALPDWRTSMQETTWQLGVCASLRIVAGRGGTVHAACFGMPDEACRQARAAAAGWCPLVEEPAELAVVTLSDPQQGWPAITRAVAAAARVTRPDGTICIVCHEAVAPGVIFLRWRQGAPLERLVHEAVRTGDPLLVADAVQTRLFARGLGERRIVLLSRLDEGAVEELEFGFAPGPEVIERLVDRSTTAVVLHEADLMFPQPHR
jgi:hypothetical protein